MFTYAFASVCVYNFTKRFFLFCFKTRVKDCKDNLFTQRYYIILYNIICF
jgi:hypothetical protein